MHLLSLPVSVIAGALLLASPACSQSRLVSSSAPVEVGSGATYVVKKVAGAKEFEFKLVFFELTQCSMRVLSNADRKTGRDLDVAAREAKAVAACNGGYFTPHFGPVGLEVAGGVRTGAYDHVNLPFGGALAVKGDATRLLRDDEITDGAGLPNWCNAARGSWNAVRRCGRGWGGSRPAHLPAGG